MHLPPSQKISKACTLLLVALVLGCQSNQSTDWNPVTAETEVRQMLDAYHNAIRQEGLTAEFNYLDSSDAFYWVPPGYESTLSYDSVKRILGRNAGAFKRIDFHWEALRVYPLTSHLASYSGIVAGVMTDLEDNESNVRIIESGTVIKRKDGWKLLCGQSASLPPQN